MPNTVLLNPTLEENLALVCKLVETQLGKAPGKLEEYKVYSYTDGEGVNHKYALTHPLIQFTADPLFATELEHQRIIDVFEPTVEDAGSYGRLYPVVRTILFTDDLPSFDTKSYVIKKIKIDSASIADKLSKPPARIRAIRREQYIDSHFLGAYYQPLEGTDEAFLHMERAPGKPLHYYWNRLNAEEFLALACALLEHIPQQLQRIITHGKHAGKQIVHCDITANNILADFNEGKWTVKLVDFGLAKAKKLDERYISKRARGTTFHYDQRMFSADLHREPLIFTSETDIYALYNVILELAGYYYRLEKRGLPTLLLRDLESPSLENLFKGMDLPVLMKSQLRELMSGMMDADRSRRISHDAALTGFQLALTSLDKAACLTEPVEKSTELPITISSLKQLIEQPLTEAPKALSTWITQFRTVYQGLSKTEQSEWKSSALSLAFNSPYAYVYVRFMDELAHYNELSCARLLIRHFSLMGSLDEEVSSLNPEWETRYFQLMSSLTLQLTEEDEEFCKKIIEFQRYQFALKHHLDAQECTRPLFLHLQLLLRQALAMPFESWLKKLPELRELFSQKYSLLLELNLFFEQIQTVLAEDGAFSGAFLESVTAWYIKFCEDIIEPQDLSEELIAEFNLRLNLVKHLLPYQRLLTEIQFGMEDDIVLMEECKDYTPEAINKLIGELRFNDSTQIRYLLLKLELFPFFSFISNLMLGSDDFLKKYPQLKEKIKKQLTQILGSFVDVELKEKIIAYSSYLNHICQLSSYLIDLAGELDALDAIKQSIPYLIDEPEIVQQALADAQSTTSSSHFKPYLRTLNEGLARILASTDESDKKEKLLAAYQLFYKEPFKYNPYHSPVVSEHSLFKPAKELRAETSVTSPAPA